MTIDHTNQPADPGAEPVEDLAARVDSEVPPPPESADPAGSAEGVPEAIQASATSTAGARRPGWVGRGVEWVRPTDLMARHSATLAGRGLTWNTTINQRARDGLGTSARRVGRRAARLSPITSLRPPPAAGGGNQILGGDELRVVIDHVVSNHDPTPTHAVVWGDGVHLLVRRHHHDTHTAHPHHRHRPGHLAGAGSGFQDQ